MTFQDEANTDRIMDENEEKEEVKDTFKLTYFLFYAFGTMTQLPGNFFINANDYWMYKFRDPNNETFDTANEQRTDLQKQFASSFSIVTNVSNLVFVILTIIMIKRIDIPKRIIIALSIFASMFILTLVFAPINTDSWQKGFFGITMVMGIILTGGSGIFLVTLIQMGSRFPPEYLPAILSGQAVCGISSALAQIFALSIGASSTITAVVYFLIGLLFVILTIAGYFWVSNKSEFYDTHLKTVPVDSGVIKNINFQVVKTVFNKVVWYNAGIVVTLGASIMVNPAVTSLVVSVNKGNGNKWNDVFFVPVSTFLMYNVFDLIGRELSNKIRQPSNGLVLFLIGVLRIGFVPLIMFCNAQKRAHLPVVFDNDLSYIFLIIVFAFTNGYLVNICILSIPKAVSDPTEKMVSSILLIVVMMVGLGACALLSPVLVNAL